MSTSDIVTTVSAALTYLAAGGCVYYAVAAHKARRQAERAAAKAHAAFMAGRRRR